MMNIELSTLPPKRKEKLDDRITVPISKNMKAALSEMDISIHEMTRRFWEQAILQWKNKEESGKSA